MQTKTASVSPILTKTPLYKTKQKVFTHKRKKAHEKSLFTDPYEVDQGLSHCRAFAVLLSAKFPLVCAYLISVFWWSNYVQYV